MARHEQEPEITPVDTAVSEYKITHPAYAQVQLSRSSGGSPTLYGSDFDHQYQIRLTITHSEERRNLARSWFFPRKEIIEIAMSESQWATLVSSMGMGSGTPVTLRHLHGEQVPGIKQPKKTDLFRAELSKEFEDQITALRQLITDFDADAKKMPAAVRDRVRGVITRTESLLRSTVPWFFKQFEEHMEETVEAAKSEVNAHAQAVMTGLGIERLAQLENKPEPIKKLVLTKKAKTND